tara:strand:+ start:3181 stop:3942 length:762 start_codon:yes stop_codon:yes gene_type:complete
MWISLFFMGTLAFLFAFLAGEEMVGGHGGTSGLGWAPMASGFNAGLVIGTLGLAFLAARSLAGDADGWILRLTVTRSASRPALVFGRFLLGIPLVVCVIAVSLLGAWIGGLTAGGFAEIVIDNGLMATPGELIDETRRTILSVFFPMLCVWSFGLLVSSLSPNATMAVAATIAALLALDVLKLLLQGDDTWFFTTYVPTLTGSSASTELIPVAKGMSIGGYQDHLFRQSILVPIPETLIFIGLATWRTRFRSL